MGYADVRPVGEKRIDSLPARLSAQQRNQRAGVESIDANPFGFGGGPPGKMAVQLLGNHRRDDDCADEAQQVEPANLGQMKQRTRIADRELH